MADWRYLAARLRGDGELDFFDLDIPLQDPEIEDVLSGDNGLSGRISPEVGRLRGPDGRPVLEEWGSALFAEAPDGNILGGGIVTHSGFDGPDWTIECTGYTGYLNEMPYTSGTFFVETDPLDIYRHVWAHVQGQPNGNLGLEIDPLASPVRIGTEMRQGEFDTEHGPMTFQYGPYKLAWHSNHNLASDMANLASETPFDWHERHYWDGDAIRHRVDLGYPSIGRRRNDLRFVVGENIYTPPSVERDGAAYASETMVLGAGNGAKQMRGTARRNTGKLRRVAVVTDSSLRTQRSVDARAASEVAYRNDIADLTSVTVIDHPHAPLGSVGIGDEIFIEGDLGWVQLETWARVLSRTFSPTDMGVMTLDIVRTSRLAS